MRSGRQCDGYPAYRRTVEIVVPIAPRPGTQDLTASAWQPSPASSALSSSSPPATKKIMVRKPAVRLIQKPRPTPPPTPVPTISKQVTILSPTVYRPGGFAFDPEEGQYFQVFRTHTASELSGFFDSEFWTRSVLQESHSEASIRHAVVALGALYKTLEKVIESPPGSPEAHYMGDSAASNHFNFALQQNGKAIARLRESFQNNEIRSQRTILMSIVLFTCFQSFIGDHRAAISQIQAGLGLLEDRRQEFEQTLFRRKEEVVEDELMQMFTRLAVQAKSYDMAFHFPEPYVIQLSPKQSPQSPQYPSSPSDTASSASEEAHIPGIFDSTQEARLALDSLCERIMRYQEAMYFYYSGPNKIIPKSVRSTGAGFQDQLQQWGKAFEPILHARRNGTVSTTERAGIDVLKMLQLMTLILFLMGFSTSEMDFDNFIGPFRKIVELAKELVVDEELSLAASRCGHANNCRHRQRQNMQFPGIKTEIKQEFPTDFEERDAYSHIKASFALDLGVVPPLFVTATKCRDRKLRREAIRLLLSSPRREGMWDSILCGKVGEWIMEVEEEGLRAFEIWDPIGANELVRPEMRVMVKEISFDLQKREATLRCGTRGAREGDPDARARSKDVFW